MGCCLSRCVPDSDMATELEAELDGTQSDYTAQRDQDQNTFGATSLLAANEVNCIHAIGEGPSGVIYKGSYRGSVVAVKKVKMTIPVKQSARESIEASLEVEATRMGSLRHPNTVLFMGACLQGDHFCIVSEYCTRGSLYDVLHNIKHSTGNENDVSSSSSSRPASGTGSTNSNGTGSSSGKKRVKLKWSLRLRLALGAARGLLYLHSADPPLVHGQLKSTNILVDDSWNAKLADFGTRRVAEAVGFDKDRLDSISNDTALLRWTAPEVLKLGEEKVLRGNLPSENVCPQAVDVYSFGIVMWELTTGEVPYGNMQTNRDIRQHVLSGNRPIMKPGRCDMKWAELMARCWSHNASRRPSAAEIVSTLESISKTESSVQASRKVNSSRADFRFATQKSRTTNSASKYKTNVRVV